jgi:hypothetical protein
MHQIYEMYFLIRLCFSEHDTVTRQFWFLSSFPPTWNLSISEQPVSKIENWIIYIEYGSDMFALCCFRFRVSVCLFVYLSVGYFTTLSERDFIASNDMMMGEWWIEKDLQGSGRGLIEVLPQHSPGDSNRAPPAYESRALPLCQPASFFNT